MWKPFFVETKNYFGIVDSPQKWNYVKKQYKYNLNILRNLRNNLIRAKKFNACGKNQYNITLSEFFRKNDMKF